MLQLWEERRNRLVDFFHNFLQRSSLKELYQHGQWKNFTVGKCNSTNSDCAGKTGNAKWFHGCVCVCVHSCLYT